MAAGPALPMRPSHTTCHDVPVPASARVIAAVLLLAYVAALAGVLMQYDAAIAITVVTGSEEWLASVGAPAAMTASGRVEFVLNAAMVVPPVILASLLVPRHPWANWVVYGFVASCAVELVQGLYLPPRPRSSRTWWPTPWARWWERCSRGCSSDS